MRCLTLNACKISFCTNIPGCYPPFSYSRRHTLSDYVGGPLCQSGHGYPSRYVRSAAALCLDVAKIEADKELALKNMQLKAQAQASTSAAVDPPPRNRDAKSRSYQPS